MRKVLFSFLFFFVVGSSFAQTIGSKVSFKATDDKSYTGTVKEIRGNQYRVAYEGFDFEAWFTNGQFQVLTSTTTNGAEITQNNAQSQDLQTIFDFGKKNGWATQIQENSFNTQMAGLSEMNRNSLLDLFNQAKTSSARFFALKSWLAGDDFSLLQKFISQLNEYPEQVQQEKCLIANKCSIIQQWQFSCSVTTVQTFLGDLCPRYAWDVKQINNYDKVANDPNHPMALQQKLILEYYGGGASARGDYSGKSIGIINPLNELVGPILGVRFYAQEITEDLSYIMPKIRNQVEAGISAPLLINFAGTGANHFILIMKCQYMQGGYQYLIYDPWDGLCDWVSESGLLQGSLSPMLSQWSIKLLYYYPTVPLSVAEINELHENRKQKRF